MFPFCMYSVGVLVFCLMNLRFFLYPPSFLSPHTDVSPHEILPVMIQFLWELLVFNPEMKTKAAEIGY